MSEKIFETEAHHANPAPLGVTVTREYGDMIVRLTGELDLSTVPVLVQALGSHGLFEDGNGPGSLVWDLSELEFLEATGLRTLLWAGAGRRSTLAPGAPAIVHRILRLTGLDSLFEFDTDR